MSGQPPRDLRPPVDYRSLERLGIMDEDFDENNRPPETPPYQRNMSQLTLPPEYISDSSPQDDDTPPIPRRSTSEEKRRETGDDDTCHNALAPSSPELRLQTSNSIVPLGRQSAGVMPVSAGMRSQLPPSRGEKDPAGLFDGETLVQRQKHYGKSGQATDYVDEHGEILRNKSAHFDFSRHDPGLPHTRRSSIDSTGVPPSVTDTDGDSEPDELYDWSDEEDLVDQEARFEAKLQPSSTKKRGRGLHRCVPLSLAKKAPLILTPLSLALLSGFYQRLSVPRSSHVRSSQSLLRFDICIIFHTKLITAVISLGTCRRGSTGLPQTYCKLTILRHLLSRRLQSIQPRILQNFLVSRNDCERITLYHDMVHLHILGNHHGGVQNENWSVRII